MNYLFNIAPDEPEKKKPRRRQAEAAPDQVPQPEEIAAPPREYKILGQAYDLHECSDGRCGSQCFDIIDEHKGKWLIECMVCGTGQRVPVVPGILKEVEDAFSFRDGIFAGLTIAEAYKQENGPEYVEWAASSHKREAVRAACRKWLDARSGAA